MKGRLPLKALAAAFALLSLGACKSVTEDYYASSAVTDPPWTVTRAEVELSGNDPIEGFNRSMFEINDFLMEYVATPVGWVYCSVLPRPAIEAIDRAAVNLEYPGRFVSCLGSARFDGAWDETFRFIVNSTLGIGGLFDPAQHWWHFYPTDSDFGLMFASWGIKPGCTLVLPLCRKTNVRDIAGFAFDYALDIKTWLPYTSWVAVNRTMRYHPLYKNVLSGTSDKYQRFRVMTALERQAQLGLGVYNMKKQIRAAQRSLEDAPPSPGWEVRAKYEKPSSFKGQWLALDDFQPENSMRDTLRAVNITPVKSDDYWYYPLSVFNSDFSESMTTRSIEIPGGVEKALYSFKRFKPENDTSHTEKLVFLMPGIGASRTSAMTLAFAELMHANGYSVVTMDSVFNWRFMLSAGKCLLPGYTPDDAQNIRFFMKAVLDDLKKNSDVDAPEISMIGWSWGGLGIMHVAALEEKENTLNAKRYLAINPPVTPAYAAKIADTLKRSSCAWDASTLKDEAASAAGKFMLKSETHNPPCSPESPKPDQAQYRINVSDSQTKMLLALDLGISIREILYSKHKLAPLDGLRTPYKWDERLRLYDEIDLVDFQTYSSKFLAQRFNGAETPESIMEKSSLRSIRDTLANNNAVRIIHTFDDFLINESDREFLDSTLKKRLLWLDCGGHMGAYYLVQAQKAILSLLEQP